MSMKISTAEAGPIAAPPSVSFWQDARTPVPPQQPAAEPHMPLVPTEAPALIHSEHVPGVIFEPSPAQTQSTYSVSSMADTARPRADAAEGLARTESRRDASAVYGMVADFAARS
jgi:hypothetical protein